MNSYVWIAAAVAAGLLVRTLSYRRSFGRWVFRLTADERSRLVPSHGPLAYERGRRDGLTYVRGLLDEHNPCHENVRLAIDEQLTGRSA
jgi:hypothetical protein